MPNKMHSFVLVASLILSGSADAQEPGWASDVVLPAPTQRQLDSIPIVQRPYRPLHVYGNTVRRLHYRGRALPTAQDVRNAGRFLMRRPYVPVQRYLK